MLPILLSTALHVAARSGGTILTEAVLTKAIQGVVTLGCVGLVCKTVDDFGNKYNKLSVEGHCGEKSVKVKGRR